MELMALRTFVAVVDEGGILAAARKLNTVQSNVTSRIQRLEEEFGTALFIRKGRGLELAPPGRVLLDYARRMLQLERQAWAAVLEVGESTGELRIGAMETFAALRLPPALKLLQQRHPGLGLRVETATSASLIDKVLDHKLDCAFVAGPVADPGLTVSIVAEEALVRVSARGSEAQARNSGQVLPAILFREGCAYRARTLAWQQRCGQPATAVMELGTLDGILGCVAVGLGWTLMPRSIVEHSRLADELATEELPADIRLVPTCMIRRHDSLPLSALETLAQAVRCSLPAARDGGLARSGQAQADTIPGDSCTFSGAA